VVHHLIISSYTRVCDCKHFFSRKIYLKEQW
jgi:hypothetical protein